MVETNGETILDPILDENPSDLARTLCTRVGSRSAIAPVEIATPSLRRPVLAARAVVSRIAISHHGLSLTATGRQLGLSKQSIARALLRADEALASHHCTADDFLSD